MQDRLRRHFIPSAPRILGVRLRPFTLWHWLTLEVAESPFVEDASEPVTIADLQLAVHVCSHPPLGPLRSLLPGRTRAAFQRALYARVWGYHKTLFETYFSEALKGPIYFEEVGKSGSFEVKTSVPLYLAECLKARKDWDDRKAWSTSPGMARWMRCVWGEVDSREQVIRTQRDVDLARECGITDYELD